MDAPREDRRLFLKGAGSTLLASGLAIGLPISRTLAAESCAVQTPESQDIRPEAALQKLKDGNQRFVEGRIRGCDHLAQAKQTVGGQHPIAAVVGCIDSRVSNEIVFDQGVGDIFSARVAGNFVNDDILGSLEFACAAAKSKVVMVIGHNACGAIRGAIDDVVLGNLTLTLANLKNAVAEVEGFEDDRTSSNPAFVQAVAEKNVALTVERIRQRSDVLRKMEEDGEIVVAGGMYDLASGRVTFL